MDPRGPDRGEVMRGAAIRAAGAWGLFPACIRDDLAISGSPERSAFRCVVQGPGERLAVLENIREKDLGRKEDITRRLDFLSSRGLPGIHPCIPSLDGGHVVLKDGRYWQASPYIPGTALERPGYAFDEWRGEAMGEFLVKLGESSRNLPEGLATRPFSILDYVRTLLEQIRIREPGLFHRLAPVAAFLSDRLVPVHGLLPLAFCHGDFHPLNVIWAEDALAGVIDWEFSGTKPENYDAALLIGCLGMEDPDALAGPFVAGFIRTLKAGRALSRPGWEALSGMVVAIRFAWLAEWLRTRDGEMIELEAVYLSLLKDRAGDLAAVWRG